MHACMHACMHSFIVLRIESMDFLALLADSLATYPECTHLFQMYGKYARAKGWQVENLSFAVGGMGELLEGAMAIKVGGFTDFFARETPKEIIQRFNQS
jgi:hypothetical protein